MSVNITADYPPTNDPARPTKIEVSIDDDTVQAMHTHTTLAKPFGIADLICDTLAHLGAPGIVRTAAAPTGTVEIVEWADREIAVRVNGTEVGRTDYDASGWAGLQLLRDVANSISHAANLNILTVDGDAEDRDNEDDQNPIDYTAKG